MKINDHKLLKITRAILLQMIKNPVLKNTNEALTHLCHGLLKLFRQFNLIQRWYEEVNITSRSLIDII